MFSLRNNDDLAPFKAPLINETALWAIYRNIYRAPAFGGGHDLYIANNAGLNTDSFTHFGYSYQAPPGYTWGENNTSSLLAGRKYYTPSETEVLYLI